MDTRWRPSDIPPSTRLDYGRSSNSSDLTLFAAFGLWLWFTIYDFGLNRECEPFTYLSFIVGTLPVISPTLRIFSITLSSISFAYCPSSTSWCLGVRRLLLYMTSNDSWPTFAIAKDRHRHCLHHNTSCTSSYS